jgi:hypothetical protein
MMLLRRVATELGASDDDDAPARQALADVVVAFAGQIERDAARQEGAEALAGGAGQRTWMVPSGRPAWP